MGVKYLWKNMRSVPMICKEWGVGKFLYIGVVRVAYVRFEGESDVMILKSL